MTRSNLISNMKKSVVAAAMIAMLPVSAFAQEGEAPAMVIDVPTATSVDDLLEKVRAGFEVTSREDEERERKFAGDRAQQQQMLADAKSKEAREEATSQALEKDYQEKEVKIAELEEALEPAHGQPR